MGFVLDGLVDVARLLTFQYGSITERATARVRRWVSTSDIPTKASLNDLLTRLPGSRTNEWPEGKPFKEAFRHGSMVLEIFAPRRDDRQTPHSQDEIYIVASGAAELEIAGKRISAATGDALFVAAHVGHRFHGMSEDFVTWVVLWGPEGGEK